MICTEQIQNPNLRQQLMTQSQRSWILKVLKRQTKFLSMVKKFKKGGFHQINGQVSSKKSYLRIKVMYINAIIKWPFLWKVNSEDWKNKRNLVMRYFYVFICRVQTISSNVKNGVIKKQDTFVEQDVQQIFDNCWYSMKISCRYEILLQ